MMDDTADPECKPGDTTKVGEFRRYCVENYQQELREYIQLKAGVFKRDPSPHFIE